MNLEEDICGIMDLDTTIINDEPIIPDEVIHANTCKYCNRSFKTIKTLTKHQTEQKCIKDGQKTYCKLCNYDCITSLQYKEHLWSQEHYDRIHNIGSSSRIIIKQPEKSESQLKLETLAEIDPFMSSPNKGESVETITLEIDSSPHQSHQSQSSTPPSPLSPHQSSQSSPSLIPPQLEPPTPRQAKILVFLEQYQNIEDKAKNMIKLLSALKHLDAFTGLTSRIMQHTKLTEENKTIFLACIKKFEDLLVKKRVRGEELFNGIKIVDIVSNISR